MSDFAEKWRATADRDGTPFRSGTACKCGAHNSANWKDGGEDWLVAHVAETHPTAFDWRAAIQRALTLPPEEALAELHTLIGENPANEQAAK